MVSTRRVTNNFYVLLLFHILTLQICVRTPITPHPPEYTYTQNERDNLYGDFPYFYIQKIFLPAKC